MSPRVGGWLALGLLAGCAPPPSALTSSARLVAPARPLTSASTAAPSGESRPPEPVEEGAPPPRAGGDRQALGLTDGTPVSSSTPPRIPRHVRVGLATDLSELSLPCCRQGVVARIGERVATLTEPIHVAPAAGIARAGFFRVQVAALKDELQARSLAQRLERLLGEPADTIFDATTDLYRVRVGRYAERAAAERAETELRRLGVDGSWLVHEGGGVSDPAFRVRRGEETRRIPGRDLRVESAEDWIEILDRRLRGRLLLYINDRGKLNLINELPLDDYLRGVVPQEMGPVIYDQLEALKAQTVAARTYTVRNLGEFASEGYDICATPRCQVYGGMNVEHPLSDRAIAETAGQILIFAGEPADALYSSTCGGHTENVEVVFPLKRAPYLRGVPCLEAGVTTLHGSVEEAESLAGWLLERLLPAPPGDVRTRAAWRLLALGRQAGLQAPADELRSLEATEVRRYVASLFDLVLDPRLLGSVEGLDALIETPPASWGERELALAIALSELGSGTRPITEGRVEDLLYHLIWSLGVVEERSGSYLRHTAEQIAVRSAGQEKRLPLGPGFGTYRRRGGNLEVGTLSLLPSDPVRLVVHHGRVLAVIQEEERPSLELAGTAHRPSWRRFRSEAAVRGAVRERYPGFDLRRLEVLDRGVSGRVARLRLVGDRGDELVLAGLQIRWTLGLPDTLFTSSRIEPADGTPGWLFQGRGWGHGVGMCQVGAYGMAMRGATYQEILAHYYTRLTLARLQAGESS